MQSNCWKSCCWLLIFAAFLFASAVGAFGLTTRDYALELSATVQESPPRITLQWRPTADTQPIQISRKLKGETAWTVLTTVASSVTNYVDNNVAVGAAYEYGLTKGSSLNFVPSGYIYAGVKAPLVDFRGKCLLVVDSTYANDLSAELALLEQDLIGDGWIVLRRDFSRFDSPAYVRWQIQTEKNNHPDLRTVFLFGHVPVPYSGNYNADDHTQHTGAWAADTFYGELNGSWTDSTVNRTSSSRPANRNTPGDGKYDQSVIPSDVDVEVGRVDLANMPLFLPKTEKDLLRQYLNKDHNFRHGLLSVARRGLLFDGFGESGGEAYAANGWRTFSTFFGSANTTELGQDQFFSAATSQSYLWSSMSSGGGDDYQSCYWVANSPDFAAYDVKTVFTTFFGSFFGDWDAPDVLLRAPLGTPTYTLTVAWAGRPHWFFHHMALGETIGYSTKLSQNNAGLYRPAQFARQVHIALMGDPTLRMHPVRPVPNLSATTNGNGTILAWGGSPDTNIVGYHVYRAPSIHSDFLRLTSSPVTSLSFTDSPAAGSYVYMVRAVKLESSASGTYFNASQGRFIDVTVSAPVPNTPVTISNFSVNANTVFFRCNGQIGQKFQIDRSSDLQQWTGVITNTLSSSFYDFSETRQTSGQRFYRTKLTP